MTQFKFVGGEYIDPMIAESFVTFDYQLFANSRTEAVEKFHMIFPGCVIQRVTV